MPHLLVYYTVIANIFIHTQLVTDIIIGPPFYRSGSDLFCWIVWPLDSKELAGMWCVWELGSTVYVLELPGEGQKIKSSCSFVYPAKTDFCVHLCIVQKPFALLVRSLTCTRA